MFVKNNKSIYVKCILKWSAQNKHVKVPLSLLWSRMSAITVGCCPVEDTRLWLTLL